MEGMSLAQIEVDDDDAAMGLKESKELTVCCGNGEELAESARRAVTSWDHEG
jgi:hypothetical protein